MKVKGLAANKPIASDQMREQFELNHKARMTRIDEQLNNEDKVVAEEHVAKPMMFTLISSKQDIT